MKSNRRNVQRDQYQFCIAIFRECSTWMELSITAETTQRPVQNILKYTFRCCLPIGLAPWDQWQRNSWNQSFSVCFVLDTSVLCSRLDHDRIEHSLLGQWSNPTKLIYVKCQCSSRRSTQKHDRANGDRTSIWKSWAMDRWRRAANIHIVSSNLFE